MEVCTEPAAAAAAAAVATVEMPPTASKAPRTDNTTAAVAAESGKVTVDAQKATMTAATAHHEHPPPQLGIASQLQTKEWLFSALLSMPPDADQLLRESLAAQRGSRDDFLSRHDQSDKEQQQKRGRLDMLKRQQQRREAWMAVDAEAVEETTEVLEEMALAVRDRLTSLRPDGYRAFMFRNGDTYEGSWKNCRMHGKGCLRREGPKDVYEGQWFAGQRSGIGSYHCAAFSFFYNGAWLDNQHHGKGELIEPEGTFAGEFAESAIHGYGEYRYKDGHVYKGDWVRGFFHGNGSYHYPTGARYEGQWESGLEHGRGAMLYANGDAYTGEWRFGYPHGHGTYERRGVRGLGAPVHVEGDWVFGSVHGAATCQFADGSIYTGEWACDLFDGEGVLRCPAPLSPSPTLTGHTGSTARVEENGPKDRPAPSTAQEKRMQARATVSTPQEAAETESREEARQHGILYKGQFRRGKRDGLGVYESDTVTYSGVWSKDAKGGGVGSVSCRGCGTLTIAWDHGMPCGEGVYVTRAGTEQAVLGSKPTPKHTTETGSGDVRRVDVRLVPEGLRVEDRTDAYGVVEPMVTAERLD